MQCDGPGAYSSLRLLASDARGSSWLYSGRVPRRYLILGLTNEQKAKLEEICTNARDEYRAASREMYGRERGKRLSAEQIRERSRKFNERREQMAKKYGDRMQDVLTDEQRAKCDQIDELMAKWREEDASIRKAMNLAMQQNRENYEQQLEGMLTDEQKAELKELSNWRGSPQNRKGANVQTSETAPTQVKETF